MLEVLNLRARWSARPESVSICAEKTFGFLTDLANCHSIFSKSWLKCPRSLSDLKANKFEPVNLSIASLERLVDRSNVVDETNQCMIKDLGYVIGRLWNGLEDDASYLWIQSGAYPSPDIMPAINAVWIEFPQKPYWKTSSSMEILKECVRIVVKNWDPDWVRVSTNKMDSRVYPDNPYVGQRVGWLTFVSKRYGTIPLLPSGFMANQLNQYGTLVEAHEMENFTADNDLHYNTIKYLSESFSKANILHPIPPLTSTSQ